MKKPIDPFGSSGVFNGNGVVPETRAIRLYAWRQFRARGVRGGRGINRRSLCSSSASSIDEIIPDQRGTHIESIDA